MTKMSDFKYEYKNIDFVLNTLYIKMVYIYNVDMMYNFFSFSEQNEIFEVFVWIIMENRE